MNGLTNIEDMTHLQVLGVSQLKKEIIEQRNVSKNLYMQGLHLNEVTQEVEGLDHHIQDNIKAHFKEKVIHKIEEHLHTQPAAGETSPNQNSQALGGSLSDVFESVDITEKSSMNKQNNL